MTPKELGFRMPAEWEKQSAIWLSWPKDRITFPDQDRIEKIYLTIIKEIAEDQTVNLLISNSDTEFLVRSMIKSIAANEDNIIYHQQSYVDSWIRDYGPIFVVNDTSKELAMIDFDFNAWGGKYPEHFKDGSIPKALNEQLKLQRFEPGIIMEGGSIDVNGKGLILTTKQCLLNVNRNPHLSKAQIEEYLCDYLGGNEVIWLNDGVIGDDTDGHIDDIARFINENTIAIAYEEDEKDDNYPMLSDNFNILSDYVTKQGKKLNTIKLPCPQAIFHPQGHRLPASYLNFLIINKKVLVPIFGVDNDQKALDNLQESFPNHKVVGINCKEMVYGYGSIHCGSQQQPTI